MQSSWIRWMSRLSLALKKWTGFTVLNWYTPLVEVNQAISSLVVIDTSLNAISTTWTLSNSKKLGNLEKRKLSVDWEWIRWMSRLSLALKKWTGFTVLNWYAPLVEVNQAISSLVVIDTSLNALSTTWTLSNCNELGQLEKRKLSVNWEWIRRLTKFCNGNWMVSSH